MAGTDVGTAARLSLKRAGAEDSAGVVDARRERGQILRVVRDHLTDADMVRVELDHDTDTAKRRLAEPDRDRDREEAVGERHLAGRGDQHVPRDDPLGEIRPVALRHDERVAGARMLVLDVEDLDHPGAGGREDAELLALLVLVVVGPVRPEARDDHAADRHHRVVAEAETADGDDLAFGGEGRLDRGDDGHAVLEHRARHSAQRRQRQQVEVLLVDDPAGVDVGPRRRVRRQLEQAVERLSEREEVGDVDRAVAVDVTDDVDRLGRGRRRDHGRENEHT